MPITADDIKLMRSERLTDEDNGGGRMTGNEVVDGQTNNLFPDISRLDRTYGRVNMRKAYLSVRSLDVSPYYGSHVIVTDPPNDGSVGVTIFTTSSFIDVRSDAQNRVESYVVTGPESPMYLYGNHPKGAKAFQTIQRLELPLPNIGEVYVLSEEDSDGVISSEQYVRISSLEHERRTFVDERGEFTRRVLTIGITAPLRQTFEGVEAIRFSDHGSPTLVRTTTQADAADYYGVLPLSAAAAVDDLEVHVASIFSQLVPTSTQEAGIVDAEPGSARVPIVAGPRRAEVINGGSSSRPYPYTQYLSRSFRFEDMEFVDTGDNTWNRFVDDGAYIVAGATDADANDGERLGTVDQESESVTFGPEGQESDWYSRFGEVSVYYQPSALVSKIAQTDAVEITTSNQGTSYTRSFNPPPSPRTLVVDYRALGNWYRLADDGNGLIVADDPNIGSGTVDYSTGSITLNLGTQPDLGSAIMFAWGYPTDYTSRAGTVSVETPAVEERVTAAPVRPGTPSFSWESGGVTKTATTDANGAISGDAVGKFHHETGVFALRPNDSAFPDSSALIVVDYDEQPGDQGTIDGTSSNDTLSFTLPASAVPVDPGGFACRFPVTHGGVTRYLFARDDGAGSIIADERPPINDLDAIIGEGIAGGSIDYATGAVSIQVASFKAWVHKQVGWRGNCPVMEWQFVSSVPNMSNPTAVEYETREDTTGSDITHQDSIEYPGLILNLTPGTAERTVVESVWFDWGGESFFDRNGTIYRDLDHENGSATPAGTINYSIGEALLDDYGSSTGGGVTVNSLLTQHGTLPVGYLAHRTPGSPVRAGSYFVRANREDNGQQVSGQADANGAITGTYVRGVIEQESGWVEIQFGELVPAAGNETEEWYSEDNVEGADVWKPILVDPGTVRFNCVVQTALPVDAELLGLDPVRLPQDGRVPVIREGNVLVIHETKTHTFPNPVSAGQTVSLPDSPIATFVLKDAGDQVVPESEYSVDYDLGEITMADPLDLSGFTEPLVGEYMIEDMALASGVDLSGRIKLSAALTQDYSTDAFVSSALAFGDLQASVPVFFDQSTWQGVFKDELEGSEPTAEYDRTNYPVELVNQHTVPQRWALVFTSSTAFDIVGEDLGVIGTGNTSTDTTPQNPNTGAPYFTLRAAGWGGGWSAGNVLRFNTDGPHAPIWINRSIQPGAKKSVGDSTRIQLRGDTD